MKRLIAVFVILALPVTAAVAQESEEEACTAGELNLAAAETSSSTSASAQTGAVSVTNATPAVAVEPATEAEATVQGIIENDGVHVVHFWAPWCPNAKNELAAGWSGLIQDNPDVSFTFVSIWNDGAAGHDVLAEYDIPERVTTLQQPDLGPSDNDANRRMSFLGIPVTWTPSTWVFHENGELAFAMNYGEMKMGTIQSLINATQKEW
jgi:thiol-disulfide isomerase/thioredoxin